MKKNKLRVGIIGCGTISRTHADCLKRLPHVDLVYACDLDLNRARKLAEDFAIEHVAADYNDVLADAQLDAVSICTDHASHSPLAVAALSAGRHVLCEKALAADNIQLAEMLAAGAAHPELVFSGIFQHRFSPVFLTLRDQLAAGVFGEILTAGAQMRCYRSPDYYRSDRWRGTWAEEGGSVLINQAIHMVDIVAWLMGGVASLAGTYSNQTHGDVIETEDAAVAVMRFNNGVLGTLEATSSSHLKWEPNVFIHGTLASVEVRHDKPLKVLCADRTKTAALLELLEAAGSRPNPAIPGKDYYGSGHAAQIEDFVDACLTGRAPFVTARSAAHAVEVVLGVYAAHHSGGWISINKQQGEG